MLPTVKPKVLEFSKNGDLIKDFPGIPEGSRICNVGHAEFDDFFTMNALEPLGDQSTAPIYAYANDHVISTIVPGDLGIPVLRHIHQCWPHYTTDAKGNYQLYLLVHGWNLGKFAVLKHVPSYKD